MPHSAPITVLAGVLVMTSTLLIAQERHLVRDPAQKLFSSSPFAHGYLHGYEMGFHNGDMDLQLSHGRQDAKSNRDYKNAKHEYKREFGNKEMFVKGYEYGFRIGYADAMDGMEFRAIEHLRALAQELPDVDARGAPILNQALERGYLDGVNSGLKDGRAETADYRPDGSDCELALRFQEPPAKFFCNVYSLGYRMGYADGFHNQRPEPEPRRIAGER